MNLLSRSVEIKITNINLGRYNNTKLEYDFNNIRTPFTDSFKVTEITLHQIFFETIKIIFVLNGGLLINKKDIGGTAINIKSLIEYFDISKNNSFNFDLPIYKMNNLNTVDYFGKDFNAIGSVHIEVVEIKGSQSFTEKISKNISLFGKYTWIFKRFISDRMAKILDISFQIQQGTFMCRLKAIAGLISIQFLSKKIYQNCIGNHNDFCTDEYCFNRYDSNLSSKRAKRLLKALYYSSAAYATSLFPVFGPKKIRDVKNNNGQIKYILDRVLIEKEDIIEIYNGTLTSIAYVMFFDPKDRLVISFRGSCSGDDIYKILDATYTPFLNGFTHSGFLRLAENFLDEKLDLIILMLKKRKCKSLLFTGHSMGGAIGIMCHLILKNGLKGKNKILKNIKIKTIVFSVPPLVSKNLIKNHNEDIEIIHYENDVVARLSYGSILEFKYLCVSINFLKEALFGFSNLVEKINKIREHLKETNKYEKLYCPGKILHIRSEMVGNKREFRVKNVPSEYFNEIKLNFKVILDHLMYKLGDAIEYFSVKN